jgi:hypothetical protein
MTHCRRELMHAIWETILDAEFIHAYTYGIVIECIDGIERRIYPRFFTYYYPEKYVTPFICISSLKFFSEFSLQQSVIKGSALALVA